MAEKASLSERVTMTLNEQIQQIAKRYTDTGHVILTEEATKAALIIPFIQALGYDTWNPLEVIPEYNCELPGTKKGDKVDFIIKKNDDPIILIECKHHQTSLDIKEESQLMRYFHAIPTKKIAILTNGVNYRFYADLDSENRMDVRPFLQFDIGTINDVILKELSRYTKTAFSIENILPAAEELKYTGAIKKYLNDCLLEPHEAFVDALARQAYEGKLTQRMFDKFKDIVKKAFNQFVSDKVSDRLSTALNDEKEAAKAQETEDDVNKSGENGKDSRIVTTQDEIDAYNIIKAILAKCVDVKRVVMRDTVSYCGILLDDSNRKPICRLYFNNPTNMSIGIFNCEKAENRHPIKQPDDIFQYADELIANVTEMCSIQATRKSSRQDGEIADNGVSEPASI